MMPYNNKNFKTVPIFSDIKNNPNMKTKKFFPTFILTCVLATNLLAQIQEVVSDSPPLAAETSLEAESLPPSVTAYLKQASETSGQGNHLSAIRLYEKAIAESPENNPQTARIYLYRGQHYALINESKKAVNDYSRALELDKTLFDAYLSRALTYQSLNEPEKAINDYNRALRFSDSSATMLSFLLDNRGNAQMMRGNYESAYNDFAQANKLVPDNTQFLTHLGQSLNELQRHEEALTIFKKVAQRDENAPLTYLYMGFTLSQMRHYREAVVAYDRALTLQPNDANALNNRGLARFNLLDLEGALSDINKSIELYPNSPYAFRNRGLVNISLRQTAQGCADLKQAIKLGYSATYNTEVEVFYAHYCTEK
jgi:tetratricopeptide (TPR) repeat protein